MLINIVKTYLSVRRAFGFKLQSVEKYLWSYANFATARGDIRVLSKTAVEWAELASWRASKGRGSSRLSMKLWVPAAEDVLKIVVKYFGPRL
jgi:hypothetical protein